MEDSCRDVPRKKRVRSNISTGILNTDSAVNQGNSDNSNSLLPLDGSNGLQIPPPDTQSTQLANLNVIEDIPRNQMKRQKTEHSGGKNHTESGMKQGMSVDIDLNKNGVDHASSLGLDSSYTNGTSTSQSLNINLGLSHLVSYTNPFEKNTDLNSPFNTSVGRNSVTYSSGHELGTFPNLTDNFQLNQSSPTDHIPPQLALLTQGQGIQLPYKSKGVGNMVHFTQVSGPSEHYSVLNSRTHSGSVTPLAEYQRTLHDNPNGVDLTELSGPRPENLNEVFSNLTG